MRDTSGLQSICIGDLLHIGPVGNRGDLGFAVRRNVDLFDADVRPGTLALFLSRPGHPIVRIVRLDGGDLGIRFEHPLGKPVSRNIPLRDVHSRDSARFRVFGLPEAQALEFPPDHIFGI